MAGMGNPDTQRQQAALHVMGYDLGAAGVDGVKGPSTRTALEQFARQNKIDPKDDAKINQALDAKLADPKTRDNFLRIVSVTNPTQSDIATSQWLLKAGGRDMSRSVDPITGLMDGRLGTDTKDAIAENRRRAPTMDEMRANMSPENFEWARRKLDGLLGEAFREALREPLKAPDSPLNGPGQAYAAAPEGKLDGGKVKVETTAALKL